MKLSNVFTFVLMAVVLFTSAACIAQGDHNELGFYVDQEMSGTHVAAAAYTEVEVHMVITYPYNEDVGRPVESINALEFSYSFPSGVAVLISTNWENTSIPSEFGDEINGHFIAWQEPFLNVNNAVYLGTKDILILTDAPFGIYLGPHLLHPSIPGHMAFLDYDGTYIIPMYPTSGSHDDPVFGVNMEVVATEKTTFDSLKALYR